jgi:hypothetical protein
LVVVVAGTRGRGANSRGMMERVRAGLYGTFNRSSAVFKIMRVVTEDPIPTPVMRIYG